mmetsp:Transcript_15834/g.60308  ORF Transcript_15834/g.60308 Transcript_15834/m.60308 type:complete len:113 (-) Transcript_15834:1703-2041(-)
MRMTVTCWRLHRPRMRFSKISLPTCASIALSGSSRTTTSGLKYAARASATRCFWPPEIVMPRSPTWVMSPAMKLSRSCSRQAALRQERYHFSSNSPLNTIFSRTVSFMTKLC